MTGADRRRTHSPHYQRFDIADDVEAWRTWRATPAAVFLQPVEPVHSDFRSSAEVLALGGVSLSELRCRPAAGYWTCDSAAADDLLRIVTLYRPAPASPLRADVSPLLLSRDAGWWLAPARLHAIQVAVPRAALGLDSSDIDPLTDHRLSTDAVFDAVIKPLLLGAAGHLKVFSEVAGAEFATVWISAVTLLIRSLSGMPCDGSDLRAVRRAQALRHIRVHLADPGLSPDSVAAALHISRRALYSALSATGDGVAALIRTERLDRAFALLADPGNEHRSIQQIATAVGARSASTFSRQFSSRFAMTPTEARARGRDLTAAAPGGGPTGPPGTAGRPAGRGTPGRGPR